MLFHPLAILCVSIFSVLLITTEWMKTTLEKKLESKGITRTWYIPLLGLTVLVLTSSIEISTVSKVFVDKIDIILLVLSFAFVSEGLRESGVFKRSGDFILEKSDNKYELILYVSFISGLLTLFTSNDIVIIALTPVIFSVARQSRVKNVKIILLSLFVIANTLSMATYIGSPTNIIVSQELGIDFVQYLTYMIIPSLLSFVSTVLVTFGFVFISEKFSILNSFEIESISESERDTEMTESMNYIWITIFLVSVLLVALLTVYSMSLLWCAIPLCIVSVLLLRQNDEIKIIKNRRMPYGIFFFGMCFFIIGEAFTSTEIVSSEFVPVVESMVNSNMGISSAMSILTSGILVNIFNDLPASAIVAPIIGEVVFRSASNRIIFIQSLLIGLNIGKYLTKVGALAGVIWFKQIKYESEHGEYVLPNSKDLFIYGIANFIFTGSILSIFLYLEYVFVFGYLL